MKVKENDYIFRWKSVLSAAVLQSRSASVAVTGSRSASVAVTGSRSASAAVQESGSTSKAQLSAKNCIFRGPV